jgi:LPS sulfotransferase NodH
VAERRVGEDDMTDDLPTARRPADRGYAICTSGRSGSNLLCQCLSSTGLLGHPLEYFNGAGRRMLGCPDFPDEPDKQIDCILTIGATANGIYGLKVFPSQLDIVVTATRWSPKLPNLKFVLLKRRDLLGQAISSLRAVQTDQWRSTMAAQGPAVYDGAQIYERLRAAARDYARWDVFLARNAIEPTVIAYEELVADPQAAVDKVASLFGLQGRVPIKADDIHLEIQRDATTQDWRARFHDEYGNLDELDVL